MGWKREDETVQPFTPTDFERCFNTRSSLLKHSSHFTPCSTSSSCRGTSRARSLPPVPSRCVWYRIVKLTYLCFGGRSGVSCFGAAFYGKLVSVPLSLSTCALESIRRWPGRSADVSGAHSVLTDVSRLSLSSG